MTVTGFDKKEVHALTSKQKGVIYLGDLVSGLTDLLVKEREEFCSRLAPLIGREADQLLPGKRPCEESPSSHCIYEIGFHNNDCLFCGRGFEQKPK